MKDKNFKLTVLFLISASKSIAYMKEISLKRLVVEELMVDLKHFFQRIIKEIIVLG